MFERGTLARDGWETVVGSDLPGWKHTGLRVATLAGGASLALEANAEASVERLIVPLAGSFTVLVTEPSGTSSFTLNGRTSVFDGPTDVLYVGTEASVSVQGVRGAGRFAVAEAPASTSYPTTYVQAQDVAVELRGAGRSSRQVHNFGTPANLAADRFIVCEVVTPAENWSSFPAHKHDESITGVESSLEEIYYFESEVSRGVDAPAEAKPFGMFSTYSSPAGAIDINAQVRTGDVALVPFGYHGPAVAAPGYDLYYLNVMAGPDPERVWNITDDPAHGWIRTTWEGQAVDPRLPYLPNSAATQPASSSTEGAHS
nr:5-deoxy-glucuronate isomerase [Lysinibacter cavernae]